MIEEGFIFDDISNAIIRTYLSRHEIGNIQSLILGCTHYPILSELIQEVMGENVILIDSGTASFFEVEDYLNGRGLRNNSSQSGSHKYFVSDLPEKFKVIAERFLGTELESLEKIDLDELIIS